MIKYLKNYCIILSCIFATACSISDEQPQVKKKNYNINYDSLDLAREYDSSLCSKPPVGKVDYEDDGKLVELTITGYNCNKESFSRHRDSFTYHFFQFSGEDLTRIIYDSMYFYYGADPELKADDVVVTSFGKNKFFPIVVNLNFSKPINVKYNPNLWYKAEEKIYRSGETYFGDNDNYYYKYSKGNDHYFSQFTTDGREKKLHLNFKIIKSLKEFLQMLKERDLYKYVEPQLRAKDKL